MDIKIEPKKGIQKKHLPYIIGATVLLALIGWSVFGNHQSTLRVDRKAIIAQQVTNDVFNDFIRVDGQVQPLAIIQLSPLEGG
ncbi:MAG: efflux RND transporter periplasmic adaptor subunit, partial [Bacteroidales bacterium]